jgi:hypothetical protein
MGSEHEPKHAGAYARACGYEIRSHSSNLLHKTLLRITRSLCAARLHPTRLRPRRPTRIGAPPSAPAPSPRLRLHPQIPSIFTPLTSASRRVSLLLRERVAAASSRPGPRTWRGATWPAAAFLAVSCPSSSRWTGATVAASAARASALSFTLKASRCVFVYVLDIIHRLGDPGNPRLLIIHRIFVPAIALDAGV